jgi:hypothetical protein
MPGSAPLADDSCKHWRAVRRWLNENRRELVASAAGLYPQARRVGGTSLLCREEWIPDEPFELQCLTLNWKDHPSPVAVDGTGLLSEHVRPFYADGVRYPTYAETLAALDPPSLFENRPSYRILSADLSGPNRLMDFALGYYFDGVNIGEALAHELAAERLGSQETPAGERLPLRSSVGDPCDLARRSVVPAITTLTLRRDRSGHAWFLLHWRDPAKVTHAGGLYQVIPSGMFQPADGTPDAQQSDFDIWRCMVREFSEELLGTSEEYDDLGTPLDYDRWPFFRQLNEARHSGRLDVFCLGLGVDPLTMVVDILTVAVFDSDVFDAAFEHLVAANAEGRVVSGPESTGVPFTSEAVTKHAGGAEPMQPAGAALLKLAWQYRARLLAWLVPSNKPGPDHAAPRPGSYS